MGRAGRYQSEQSPRAASKDTARRSSISSARRKSALSSLQTAEYAKITPAKKISSTMPSKTICQTPSANLKTHLIPRQRHPQQETSVEHYTNIPLFGILVRIFVGFLVLVENKNRKLIVMSLLSKLFESATLPSFFTKLFLLREQTNFLFHWFHFTIRRWFFNSEKVTTSTQQTYNKHRKNNFLIHNFPSLKNRYYQRSIKSIICKIKIYVT